MINQKNRRKGTNRRDRRAFVAKRIKEYKAEQRLYNLEAKLDQKLDDNDLTHLGSKTFYQTIDKIKQKELKATA